MDQFRVNTFWDKQQKTQWLICLFCGCGLIYACRTAVPVAAVKISEEFHLSKTQMGTVLSSFYWGYALSQVFGGNLADRLGGDIVLVTSALAWGILTFITPMIVYMMNAFTGAIFPLILTRSMQGALQGVHYPSMTSLLALRVSEAERAFSYSLACAGTHAGLLVLGYFGSLIITYYEWQHLFIVFGGVSLLWAIFVKFVMIRSKSEPYRPVPEKSDLSPSAVPWGVLMRTPAFWSIVLGHLACNNAFYILISWLPTYFNEVFPDYADKGWMFNVVPWIISLPCTIFSGWFSDRLISSAGFSVTNARKLCEFVCQFGCGVAIIILGQVHSFPAALLLMGLAIACTGFHCGGILINPMDIAPAYSGAVFGIMNTVGAIPGFIGVYLAGYILDMTASWAAVFNLTAFFSFLGGTVYILLGTGKQVI